MSNMNQDAFAQGGIQELSFNEIDEVQGAGLGLAIGAGLLAGAIVVAFAAGYKRAHKNAD